MFSSRRRRPASRELRRSSSPSVGNVVQTRCGAYTRRFWRLRSFVSFQPSSRLLELELAVVESELHGEHAVAQFYMLSTSSKRGAPPSDDSRPYKRQATSSPEEGELDDGTPPASRRSPTPMKTTKLGNKVPFPFKKKLQDNKSEGSQSGRGQPSAYSRLPDEDRRPERSLPPRPHVVPDSRADSHRGGDYRSRHDDSTASRGRWDRDERRYDDDRSFYGDRWEPRDPSPRSPRRHPRRRSSRSRSRSTGRSRSPYSPESTGREKHRLPPPRSPILDTYSSSYDDRDIGRDRRYNGSSRSGWDGDSYVPNDDYRTRDSRDSWRRDDGYSRRLDDDRDSSRVNGGDSYRPMSPRSNVSPRNPYSPRASRAYDSHRSPERLRSPPPPPPNEYAPPPPSSPPPAPSNLPSRHAAVKIPLPRRPPTPKRSPNHSLLEPDEKSNNVEKSKENGHSRAVARRDRRKPVQRTRADDLIAYGRIFEGCGSKSDYDIITKLGEGTFGYVLFHALWLVLSAKLDCMTIVKCTKPGTT